MAKDAKAGGADKKGGKPAAGKKGEEKKGTTSKKDHYSVEGGKLERKGRNCPKCGPGVFLAEHKDRNTCGKCGYTEFKTKK
ncbi:MAG: 30S ribosomal protein S27ae [Methanomassiliicoccus sp.]|nr:30S ribosomal protein S27ae [Methanomassiliicoccus sp.]